MGFTSCQKIDECHDLSLIGQNPNEGDWMYYAPVCGCDGKTYTNKDIAMYDFGVINYTDGPCDKKQKEDPEDECHDLSLIGKSPYEGDWMYYAPVCGCDGVTYTNKDVARYDYGVINYTDGPCDKNPVDDCHDSTLIGSMAFCKEPESNPVCGCDGITYDSPEEAMYQYGIKNFTYGSCHKDTTYIDDCIDPTQIKYEANCIEVYAPVCGCNGITYSNSCEATNAGVKEFRSGLCASIPIIPFDTTNLRMME